MGSVFSSGEKKDDSTQRRTRLWSLSSQQFIAPMDVPVKVQMEFILTHWLRNCDQMFPMEILQLIVNTLLYQPTFAVEHNLKLKDGNGFFKELARHYKERDPEQQKCDYLLKFVLIGESRVGKSSLMTRYREDSFFDLNGITTIGIDFAIRTINVNGQEIKIQIWDNPVPQRFRNPTTPYHHRGADGVILVYDVTDRYSFERIPHWNEESNKYGQILQSKILIGNKRDLEEERVITAEEGEEMAVNLDATEHMETSAKTAENVEKAIEIMATRVLHRIQRANTPWID